MVIAPAKLRPRKYTNSETSGTPMTTLNEQEIQRNPRFVAHAIAQQELEGLRVSKATVEDTLRAARGSARGQAKACPTVYDTLDRRQMIIPARW